MDEHREEREELERAYWQDDETAQRLADEDHFLYAIPDSAGRLSGEIPNAADGLRQSGPGLIPGRSTSRAANSQASADE